MKKIVLSLAGAMAVAAFAPEASALPVFARQTGMACSACHFQHFPLLNGFGRAFKAAGFTMMGAQGKVEEGTSLSIPAELNMAVLTSAGYEKSNATPAAAPLHNSGNGQWFVPGSNGEASLFFGGRVSENAGFLAELGLPNGAAALGSAKLPILFDVADGTRAGLVFFTTDAQGVSYGMETLNTGANAIHMQSNTPGFNGAHANALSAQQYIGTAGTATGAAIVATNDNGFINISKYDRVGIATTGLAQGAAGTPVNGAALGSTYARLAGTFDLAGWDTGVGIQSWSGQSVNGDAAVGAVATEMETKATAIDGQMQGALANMPVGFYASYATAPVGTATAASINAYNFGGVKTKSSFNVNGEVGIVPDVATLGAGFRVAKSGASSNGLASGTDLTDNAIFLTATYKIQQNMLARLSYTSNSGSFWTAAQAAAIGSKTTTINIYTLF